MFLVGACWCLLVPVGACWCLDSVCVVGVGACWCLLVPVGACWCLLVPVGACLLVPVGVVGVFKIFGPLPRTSLFRTPSPVMDPTWRPFFLNRKGSKSQRKKCQTCLHTPKWPGMFTLPNHQNGSPSPRPVEPACHHQRPEHSSSIVEATARTTVQE